MPTVKALGPPVTPQALNSGSGAFLPLKPEMELLAVVAGGLGGLLDVLMHCRIVAEKNTEGRKRWGRGSGQSIRGGGLRQCDRPLPCRCLPAKGLSDGVKALASFERADVLSEYWRERKP